MGDVLSVREKRWLRNRRKKEDVSFAFLSVWMALGGFPSVQQTEGSSDEMYGRVVRGHGVI